MGSRCELSKFTKGSLPRRAAQYRRFGLYPNENALVAVTVAAVVLVAAAHFVAVKLMAMTIAVEVAVISTMRIFAAVPVMRVIAIVYMPVPTVWTVEPWAGTDEKAVENHSGP